MNGDGAEEDFLRREKAALGDDAARFASAGDNAVTMEDGNDDLLGGGGDNDKAAASGGGLTEFESSYPAVDTRNDVRDCSHTPFYDEDYAHGHLANRTRRYNHRCWYSIQTVSAVIIWELSSSGRRA